MSNLILLTRSHYATHTLALLPGRSGAARAPSVVISFSVRLVVRLTGELCVSGKKKPQISMENINERVGGDAQRQYQSRNSHFLKMISVPHWAACTKGFNSEHMASQIKWHSLWPICISQAVVQCFIKRITFDWYRFLALPSFTLLSVSLPPFLLPGVEYLRSQDFIWPAGHVATLNQRPGGRSYGCKINWSSTGNSKNTVNAEHKPILICYGLNATYRCFFVGDNECKFIHNLSWKQFCCPADSQVRVHAKECDELPA